MKILISSSQNENIDDKYKESAHKITSFLADDKNTLVWGSGCRSIMGICYEEFAKKDCEILGYTTKKYVDEIELLPKAKHTVMEDTFDLKKVLFNESDMVLVLPGGTGTVSELFTYLEEVRSNDVNKTLVVFDEYGHFSKVLEVIEDLIVRKFNSNSIYDYLHIAHNLDEFKTIYDKCKKETKKIGL